MSEPDVLWGAILRPNIAARLPHGRSPTSFGHSGRVGKRRCCAQAANSPIASARIKLVGGHLCASGRLLKPCGQAQGRLTQLPGQIARGVNSRVGVVECCSGLYYESMRES